jgi:hypothetical protein
VADPDVERTIAELQELSQRLRALSPEQRAALLASIREDETTDSPPFPDDTDETGATPPP